MLTRSYGPTVASVTATVYEFGEPDGFSCDDTTGVTHKNQIAWTIDGDIGSYTIDIQVSYNGGAYSTHKTNAGSSPYVENYTPDGTAWCEDTYSGSGLTFQYKVRIMNGAVEVDSMESNVIEVASDGSCGC